MSGKRDWSKEERAVQAVQMAFDLSNEIQRAFRVSAALQDVSTANMVRKVLKLPYDFDILARKYGLAADDRVAIRQKVAEELQTFARSYLPDSEK